MTNDSSVKDADEVGRVRKGEETFYHNGVPHTGSIVYYIEPGDSDE